MASLKKMLGVAMVVALASVVSTASATPLGFDDFDRGDATDLGSDWTYSNGLSGSGGSSASYDIVGEVANATGSQCRALYTPYELFSGPETQVVIEVLARPVFVWSGLTFHHTTPDGSDYFYLAQISAQYNLMRIVRYGNGSMTEVGELRDCDNLKDEVASGADWIMLRVTTDNNGHFVFDTLKADGTTLLERLTCNTTALVLTGGYAGMHYETSGGSEFDDFQMTIPEPATMCLLAIGGIGILLRRRRS